MRFAKELGDKAEALTLHNDRMFDLEREAIQQEGKPSQYMQHNDDAAEQLIAQCYDH